MMRVRTTLTSVASNLRLWDLNLPLTNFACLYGLDSITSLDPLAPAGPQILENRFEMEQLKLGFDVNMGIHNSVFEKMTLLYTVRDSQVQVDVLVAMDLNQLGEIKLGSFFDIGHILYCAVPYWLLSEVTTCTEGAWPRTTF
jgi:hypothetical protein